MSRPGIALVFLQAVEVRHVLRVAHRLEHPHILTAGKHIRALELIVDADYTAGNIFLFVQMAVRQLVGQRLYEIPPDQRRILDLGCGPGGNLGQVDHIEMAIQKPFALLPGSHIIIKHMQCIMIFILRVNAVAGKTTAQSVAALMHHRDGTTDHLTADGSAISGKHSTDGASGRDAHLTFLQHVSPPFTPRSARKTKKAPAPAGICQCERPCSYALS